MSNICEWRNGERIYCNDGRCFLPHVEDRYCRFCGADIRKPEQKYCYSECGMRKVYPDSCGVHNCKYLKIGIKPEPAKPLIVKSGGTFVTEHEGINYLWTEQEPPEDIGSIDFDGMWRVHCGWIDFNEITLDDEIAKLRPMVRIESRLCGDLHLYKLYGVHGEIAILDATRRYNINTYNLATPKELQEKK